MTVTTGSPSPAASFIPRCASRNPSGPKRLVRLLAPVHGSDETHELAHWLKPVPKSSTKCISLLTQ